MQGLEQYPGYEDLRRRVLRGRFRGCERTVWGIWGIEGQNMDEEKEEPTGISSFLLTVLKNVEGVTPLIEKYIEHILKLL